MNSLMNIVNNYYDYIDHEYQRFNYQTLDAKALALYGLALCEKELRGVQNPAVLVEEAKKAFQAARKITSATGIVNRVKRLLEILQI